ncbi:YbjN domain-containing protein [Sphingobium sp. B12D2B]|uniref:YbjN domain-containing protein n=1 Tax=Sphingobium sp. B12D2B TaxID=2940577 RepID=UPI002223FCB1|nr:YbjN domain-containing protein [Sphingobium sp. B12D2B]MCW2350530.1 hypothetical protein [Sphingobium sp. B12D2B]
MKTTAWISAAACAFVMMTAPAHAADEEPCGKGLVCANAPETVVKAIQDAGYKASLSKSESSGNPMITSAASGYNFNIYFYECEDGKNCASLHFSTSFVDDGKNTPELANLWNRKNRFSQMAVDEDGSLDLTYDVTTYGGLTQRNFADVVDWWQTMLGALNSFFREQGHID